MSVRASGEGVAGRPGNQKFRLRFRIAWRQTVGAQQGLGQEHGSPGRRPRRP